MSVAGRTGNESAAARRVVRPLLGVSRSQIEEYILRNRLEAVTDSSNADPAYMRNRLRNELIPLLRDKYNPGVVDALRKLSETARIDGGFLSQEADNAYDACLLRRDATSAAPAVVPDIVYNIPPDPVATPDPVAPPTFSLSRFNALHAAIAARVIRRAYASSGGDIRRLGAAHISAVLELAASGRTGAQTYLPGGVCVRRSYDELIFAYDLPDSTHTAHRAAPAAQHAAPASAPRAPAAPAGYVTKSLHNKDIEIVEQICNIRYNSSEQLFDADALCPDDLVLRRRRSGDVFFPINAPGAKKLKDFFIDARIPAKLRDTINLLALGPEIVWVIGYRVSERYKVTNQTKNVLRVRYFMD
jgi:tRNA(Ile)-lysidine synthase